MILNFRAKLDLRRKIREGKGLLRRVTAGDSHDIETHLYRWRDNCGLVIKSYFGEDHFLFRDISQTGFGIGVMVVVSGVPEVRRDNTASYISGVESCLKVLRDCQNEIKVNGLIKYRVRVTLEYFAFFAVLLTLFVQVVLSFHGGEGPNTDELLTEAQREMQCKHMRVEFDNLLWEFDKSTASSYDSIQGEFNSRGVLQSGEPQSYLARIRESNQRRRIQAIDSFYLAYMFQGCDTTKLRLRR